MLTSDKHNYCRARSGFTLIELLVVVLIIGILAAIALPQYQVAVAKSKYVQAMAVGDKMWMGQQEYFLENGEWALTFDDLVIEPPSGYTRINPEHSKVWYTWGTCWFSPNPNVSGQLKETNCTVLDGALCFLRGYRNQVRHCRVYYNKPQADVAEKICKSMGEFEKQDSSVGYRQYIIQ